ncbi:MAG TPA: glycoside hydrolase family 3 protein [Candidatus Stackebrandtia faecavium]|nr:glycoside hydrolase family 3 protein [Candidatus Stackebrandtia faecavium]
MTRHDQDGWTRRSALSAGLIAVSATAAVSACGTETGIAEAGHPGRRARSRAWARRTLRKMSTEEKIGQLFVTYAYGQTADTTDPEDVKRNQEWVGVDNGQELIEKYKLGGIIYFGWSDNVEDPKKTATLSNGLQKAALGTGSKVPLLISTDQEQGVVVRVGPPATQFPGNMALGATRAEDKAKLAAEITGAELRAIGINQDFAPTADVNVNPANPVIGVRSFSSDPQLAADLTAAQVAGFQSGKDAVTSCAKHFPGHGDTATDSHVDLPEIDHTREEWEKLDAPPFESAIAAEIDAIMTAHITFRALDESGDPATLSKPILTGLLREELGYDGMVITDSLSMDGVNELYPLEEVPVRALQAGVDMLLMPPKIDVAYNAVVDAVAAGDVSEKALDKSVERILTLKHFRGIVDDPLVDVDKVDSIVGIPEHLEAADRISDSSITLVKNDAKLLPLEADGLSVFVTGAGSAVSALAKALKDQGAKTTEYDTGTEPDQAAIDKAVADAAGADVVVAVTREVAAYPNQAKLVKALDASGVPVAVVSVKEPYDINQFPDVETYVATYSYTDVAMGAAARGLCGVFNPSGKLPVMIPTADDPQKPLFEFGHGQTY